MITVREHHINRPCPSTLWSVAHTDVRTPSGLGLSSTHDTTSTSVEHPTYCRRTGHDRHRIQFFRALHMHRSFITPVSKGQRRTADNLWWDCLAPYQQKHSIYLVLPIEPSSAVSKTGDRSGILRFRFGKARECSRTTRLQSYG